jgi:thiamine-monophosphate kinase
LGNWLAQNRLASAMMDVSDGLSTDLTRLCGASGVGAVISERALPTPVGVSRTASTRLALHGGDDYELLFTVPAGRIRRFRQNWSSSSNNQTQVPVSLIGVITRKRKLLLVKDGGTAEELVAGGWDPFRQGS